MCIAQEMTQQAPDEVAPLEAAVRAATHHVHNLTRKHGVKRGKHDVPFSDRG